MTFVVVTQQAEGFSFRRGKEPSDDLVHVGEASNAFKVHAELTLPGKGKERRVPRTGEIELQMFPACGRNRRLAVLSFAKPEFTRISINIAGQKIPEHPSPYGKPVTVSLKMIAAAPGQLFP